MYRNWESEKLNDSPAILQINNSTAVTAARFCWCWSNTPVRQFPAQSLGHRLTFVWLFVTLKQWRFGLVWFCKSALLFCGFIEKLQIFLKWVSCLSQLCEYSVRIRIKSGHIHDHGFKMWQMIGVNSGFYLLNHIKAPKWMHPELRAHNLS